MSKHVIHATMLARCPFSVATEMLGRSLREKKDMTVSVTRAIREHVRLGWAVVDDLTDESRRHDAIAIYWTPDHPTFPSFAGTITVRPHYRESYIRITGTYDPPLGRAGRLFDRFAGRHIARATLLRLIRELVRDIESRYLVYLQEIGAAGAHRHSGGKRDEVLRTH